MLDVAALGVLAIDYLSALDASLDTSQARIGLGMCVVLIAGGINLRGTAVLEKYSIAFAAVAVIVASNILVSSLPTDFRYCRSSLSLLSGLPK